MPDFRVDDTAAEHPKLRAAGLAAFGLWAAAGSWCMNPAHLTDGWVPLHYVQSWPSGKNHAKKLVAVGLWAEEQRDGQRGYRFHDWDNFQRSASSIEDEKRKARDRMARIRSGNVRPNIERTNGRTEPARSANVHDSLTLTHTHTPSGDFGGEGHQGNARATKRPLDRCSEHVSSERPPPCARCADARRAREQWDSDSRARIRACRLCDGEGQRWDPVGKHRGTVGPCDHRPMVVAS